MIKIIHILLFLSGLLLHSSMFAQGLSFTRPAQLFSDRQTDREPTISNFNGNYFIAWKEAGEEGNLLLSNLGKQYDTAASLPIIHIPGASSAFAPSLQSLNGRLYFFWIATNGRINYIINKTDQEFDLGNVYEVPFTDQQKVSLGISITAIGNQLLLATHADNKETLLYVLLQTNDDGSLKPSTLQRIQKEKSKNYPHVTAVNASIARFCWQGKSDLIYYADFDVAAGNWSETKLKGNSQTTISPAIHKIWNTEQLFYIWRGYKKDTRMYYRMGSDFDNQRGHTELPTYFGSDFPVSVCKVDENNFIMAYTGMDHNLYLSNFSAYQSAKWMEQLVKPLTGNKTLKDIVIPGSHDAGMSVLTATGGQQKGTINECNTLTQALNIEQQLNSGIRMFDFRAGTYNKMLYTKHASSDCMEDALGGGYGEGLRNIATALHNFLLTNKQEIVLATFSHFCEKETPLNSLKDSLIEWIGPELIYTANQTAIGMVPLSELAGKVVLSFEVAENPDNRFPACSIADKSGAFINFRRAYAATNNMTALIEKERTFFVTLNNTLNNNDLVRLDWQLTQSNDEAPLICNDFEDEKIHPLVNGAMLLTNLIRKNKSIMDHSLEGNKYLPVKLNEWIKNNTINKQNKPNILYVDVAGAWITDYCIDLLRGELYR